MNEKYKLKNGLEVILSEDHRLPLVAVYVFYHVGPVNERPGRTGFRSYSGWHGQWGLPVLHAPGGFAGGASLL